MEIKIRSFGSIAKADLTLDGLTLVAGRNAAGKSCTLRAVAAALTGSPLPEGVLKKTAHQLVRNGSKAASVQITGPEGRVHIFYPEAALSSNGIAPRASRVAAGLDRPRSMPLAERAAWAAKLLKTIPSLDDLTTALQAQEIEYDESVRAVALKEVTAYGWDEAYTRMRKRWTEAKGSWSEATGTAYGSAKAVSWTPTGWRAVLAEQESAKLQAAVGEAKTQLTQAVKASAVSEARRLALVTTALQRDERQKLYDSCQIAVDTAQLLLKDAEAHRNTLPEAKGVETTPCPHCHQPVVIAGDKLARPTQSLSQDEIERRGRTIAAADANITALRTRVSAEIKGWDTAKLALNESADAEQTLAQLSSAPPAAAGIPSEAEARTALDAAETALDLVKVKRRADVLHAKIVQYEAIAALLADTGLRKTRLESALESFNDGILAPLCEVAGWSPVTLMQDLSFQYGGRTALLSASELWRLDAIIAIAAARLDGSCAVLLDAADILDAIGKNGLIKLIRHAGIPALIGMTLAHQGKVPQLSGAGLYWIENGTARAIASPQTLAPELAA